MAKEFRTILDEIQEMFGKATKPPRVAQFGEERVSFGIEDWMKTNGYGSISLQELRNQTPIDGDIPKGGTDNANREDRKQLRLPQSSTIQSAAYWPEKNYLVVSFKSGHTYGYDDVPVVVVKKWEWAPSSGSFFYRNIRMSFKYRKLG